MNPYGLLTNETQRKNSAKINLAPMASWTVTKGRGRLGSMIKDPQQILEQVFGYSQFHPLQKKVIDDLMRGQDALVLMPTGGGKSLCYQVPALCLPGTAVVISPLLALMKDQVEALKANGVAAEYYNSTQNEQTAKDILRKLREEEIQLLYLSPERLFSPTLQSILLEISLSLIAIDEAHCISSWGHDFRPGYTRLGSLRDLFPEVPLMALTATADPAIRRDIQGQLKLGNQTVHLSSFDRPNLHLRVSPGQKRFSKILDFLSTTKNESGIIYCSSRKGCETLAKKLREKGYQASPYHAGMDNSKRARIQEEFLSDKIPIICATIAFGMGVDKSNIRWIIHYNLPKNLEGFYQEIGRAGRDGLPAQTLLFYSYADVAQNLRFMEEASAERRELLEAKLERMKKYAESLQCRRRTMLSYFGEITEEDCGNCDVCDHPPKTIDGTILAQKFLSAVARTRQKATLKQIVLILRGSQARELTQMGWQNLKTFGVGSDLPYPNWMEYGSQLINAGFVSVAYDQGMVLELGALGKKVLFEDFKVQLVAYRTPEELKLDLQDRLPLSSEETPQSLDLLEKLKAKRKELAGEQGVPPYIVFGDKTLKEISLKVPENFAELLRISGVGEVKLKRYGEAFLAVIRDWLN